MNLKELIEQCQRDSDRWFPSVSKDLPFTVLALVGETGEMANIVKKVVRGSISLEKVKDDLGEEAVDVLIYLCMVFAALDIDPIQVYKEKRQKNELRFSRPDGDPRIDGVRIFPVNDGLSAAEGYF